MLLITNKTKVQWAASGEVSYEEQWLDAFWYRLRSHQAPGVAGENEPRPLQLPLIQISSIGWRTIF